MEFDIEQLGHERNGHKGHVSAPNIVDTVFSKTPTGPDVKVSKFPVRLVKCLILLAQRTSKIQTMPLK